METTMQDKAPLVALRLMIADLWRMHTIGNCRNCPLSYCRMPSRLSEDAKATGHCHPCYVEKEYIEAARKLLRPGPQPLTVSQERPMPKRDPHWG